ncbi:hypothetical protein [Dysgonomonas massiliensis]|uniref:hypothetical protein n=1 Tax=Dysgonomonas massiliensis TaxID=2040292 RepID=UPI000C762ED1|nr:hypothetical protein [Dysgonomonas massiliensis]
MSTERFIRLDDIYLRDSSLESIFIYKEDYILYIDIVFKVVSKTTTFLKLRCIDVVKYNILWDSDYSFYDVSHYKLLKDNELFYLSLDPYEESDEISELDNDFLLCRQMKVWSSVSVDFTDRKDSSVI